MKPDVTDSCDSELNNKCLGRDTTSTNKTELKVCTVGTAAPTQNNCVRFDSLKVSPGGISLNKADLLDKMDEATSEEATDTASSSRVNLKQQSPFTSQQCFLNDL